MQDSLPHITVKNCGADPRFVDAIQAAVCKIEIKSPFARRVLRAYRRGGEKASQDVICRIQPREERDLKRFLVQEGILEEAQIDERSIASTCPSFILQYYPYTLVGSAIFKSLLNRKGFFPFSDFQVVCKSSHPSNREMEIRCQSMNKIQVDEKFAYIPPHEPTIEIGRRCYTVAFHEHVFEQAVLKLSRYIHIWKSYTAMGDLYGFFALRNKFESGPMIYSSYLRKQTPTIALVDFCPNGFFGDRFRTEIMGIKPTKKHVYFLVGYCPLVAVNDYAVCWTLLPPGYEGTPEEELWKTSTASDRPSVKKFRNMRGNSREKFLRETGDFSVLRWLHQNGCKQVFEEDESIFLPPYYLMPQRR